jgi:uncharacterized membrane protein YeaQ/YmgE (transglycosylase-associated protein family)
MRTSILPIIGLIVGVVAKFIMPGNKNEPKGFILTAILGIVGAFVATYLGDAVGWYKPGESAGFVGGVVGAIILLGAYGLTAFLAGGANEFRQAFVWFGSSMACCFGGDDPRAL